MTNLLGSTRTRIERRKGKFVAVFQWYQYKDTYTLQGLRARITYYRNRNMNVDLEENVLQRLLWEIEEAKSK